MINKVNWDSNFFGYKVGKYDVKNQVFNENEFKNNCTDYNLVYIFSDIELSVSESIKLVDIKTLFEKKINTQILDIESIVEYNKKIHSYRELEELAYLSGTYSRYKKDENFKNDEFKKLYKIWIDKSLYHNFALKVFVKVIDNKIAGFVTLKENNNKTSQIGLISVSDEFRGKGIASELIHKSEYESYKNGFDFFQVPTQFDNKAALNLYSKNGFEIVEKKYIYHFWNL